MLIDGSPVTVFFATEKCTTYSYREVRGDVPPEVDLSNDITARKILAAGAQFAQKKCPNPNKRCPAENINVYLYQAGKKSFNREWLVQARSTHACDKLIWEEYDNYPLKERQKAEKQKRYSAKRQLEKEQREREMQAAKEKEKRERREASENFNQFVQANAVKEWPSMKQLSSNPFVYERATVALTASFLTMESATRGVFKSAGDVFIVSDIPKGMFRVEGQNIVLAGKVIGKTDFRAPIIGQVQVPYLRFVGVHFCKDRQCSDIIRE
ncbi:MAG: hypothetical protein AB7Y74_15870 [Syntrophorhabdus sp.]